jgi:hypothetical protein
MSSIAEEIQRLKDAKSNIKTSIQNKGVSVDDTATLDAYPALIDSIEQTTTTIDVGAMGGKFAYSKWTDIPSYLNFNGTAIADFSTMFYGNQNLTSFTGITVNCSESFNSAFQMCYALTGVTLNGAKPKDIGYLFSGDSNLTDVGEIDCSNIGVGYITVTTSDAFYGCTSLANFGGLKAMKYNFSLSPCTALTETSLVNVLNGLYDFTGNKENPGTSQGTLTLGSTNLAKLTDEQKAIATNKGWTLA